MNLRRLILIAALLGAAAIVTFLALFFRWRETQPIFGSAPAILAPAQAYSRDRVAGGQPLASAVSLRELLIGGYIATNDARMFEGMDVTVSLSASEAFPQSELIHVRMADGSELALLADGSVHQSPR